MKLSKRTLVCLQEYALWFHKIEMYNDPYEMWCIFEGSAPNQAISPLVDLRSKKRETTTVCCFSKSQDILTMWAHYADGLQGICVEYDEAILEIDGKCDFRIFPVDYLKEGEFNVMNVAKLASGEQESFKKFFLTKSHHWREEQEIRILREVDDSDELISGVSEKIIINKEAIKSITIGEKAESALKEIVKQIFKGTNVAIMNARMSECEYKIDITLDIL